MIVLDTDHLSEIQQNSSVSAGLIERINLSQDREISTTIISCVEQFRGRLAGTRHRRSGLDEVVAYAKFAQLITFYASWRVLPFDQPSALKYDRLMKLKIRIGT